MIKDGVEPEITQAQDADFVAGRFRSVDIGAREGGTKAIGGRVAENDQNACDSSVGWLACRKHQSKKGMSETSIGLIAPPEGYGDWLTDLKGRIHQAQQRASIRPLNITGRATPW